MSFFIFTSCGSEPSTPIPSQTPANEASTAQPTRKAADDADTRPIILAFGDSLTEGYGLPAGSGYPELLQKELDSRGYEYRVINRGMSGDTTSGGLARLPDAVRLKPAIVILELGANDGLQGMPTESTRSNLDEMISLFRKTGAIVVLAGMTLPRNFGADYIGAFEKIFPDLAKRHGIPLIPFFLEGAAGHPDLVLDDGMHPNAAGYKVTAALVLKYLEPLLKKK